MVFGTPTEDILNLLRLRIILYRMKCTFRSPESPGTATHEAGTTEVAISATRLWLVLAKAHRAMAHFVEGSIAAENLCLSDFMVLEVILHKGPLTMSVIGKKVLLANASMTSAIDRLERRGFVRRKGSMEDRRTRLVKLTPDGKALIEAVFARHEQQLEALMAELSMSERAALHAGLKQLGLMAASALQSA